MPLLTIEQEQSHRGSFPPSSRARSAYYLGIFCCEVGGPTDRRSLNRLGRAGSSIPSCPCLPPSPPCLSSSSYPITFFAPQPQDSIAPIARKSNEIGASATREGAYVISVSICYMFSFTFHRRYLPGYHFSTCASAMNAQIFHKSPIQRRMYANLATLFN